MRLDKPQVLRTQVTALNTQTGKSKTVSFYDVTPELFFDNVERLAKADFEALDLNLEQLDAPNLTAAQRHDLVQKIRGFIAEFRPAPTPAAA